MDKVISAPLFAGGLFLGMLVFLELGRRVGAHRLQRDSDAVRAGLGIVEAAFFGIFSLLLAFSFSGALSRFDDRRAQIVEEANYIGTAYLRLDLLAPEAQPVLRDLFRQYLQSRVTTYARLPDLRAALAELERSKELQGRIWSHAITAVRAQGSHPSAAMLLLPALNEMFDITTTRTMAGMAHPPRVIYWLLFLLGLLCAGIAGHGMASATPRAWMHILGFALIMSLCSFVIIDIEYPRVGFFRLDAHDRVLSELLESLKR
jgi:hypothetical protein